MARISPWRGGTRESSGGSSHNPGPAATKLYFGTTDATGMWGDVSTFGGSVADVSEHIEDRSFDHHPTPNSSISRIAYGKDGSDNPLIVMVTSADSESLWRMSAADWAAAYANGSIESTNITGEPNVKQLNVAWGNGVWMSIGHLKPASGTNKHLYRSTDGTTWSAVAVGSLSSMPTDEVTSSHQLVTDGAGKWWFAVYDNAVGSEQSMIYCSEDDGQTWSLHHTLADSQIYHMAYTNDTLVVTYNYIGVSPNQRRAISAAGSATSGASNWGTSVALAENGDPANSMIATNHNIGFKIAAGGGRVVACDTSSAILLIVDGKTITVSGARTFITSISNFNSNIMAVATDGEGNWYIGSDDGDGGDVAKNTNNGDPASWVLMANRLNKSGDRKIKSMAIDRYLPL
jgi:hypothetical protein